jgi:hypothetical protein
MPTVFLDREKRFEQRVAEIFPWTCVGKEGLRFAGDSPVERTGFEPPVPLLQGLCSWPAIQDAGTKTETS